MYVRNRDTTLALGSNQYDNVREITGDRKISEDLVTGIANHILKKTYGRITSNLSRDLKQRPLTHEICSAALRIIQKDLSIVIVDDHVNMDSKSGLTKFYWDRELNVNSPEIHAILDENQIAALQQTRNVSIKLLTMSRTAFNALRRYSEQLASDEANASMSVLKPYKFKQEHEKENEKTKRETAREKHRLLEKEKSCCTLL
jgi:hypothetical protein